tara:strand:+ start:625 stop:741 length:117 start_codon:yes stop_codon:yes gene_type:complete
MKKTGKKEERKKRRRQEEKLSVFCVLSLIQFLLFIFEK